MEKLKRALGAPVRAVRWLMKHEPVLTAAAVGVVVNTVADQIQAGADLATMKRNVALAVLAFGMRLRVTPTGRIVLNDPAPPAAPAVEPPAAGPVLPPPVPRSFLAGEYHLDADGYPDTGVQRFHP